MYKGDTIPGLLLSGVGLCFLIPALGLGLSSTTSDNVPGAGFFPVVIASAVILFGILLFLKGLKANGKMVYFEMDEEQKANIRPFFVTILSIAAFFLIWKFVRFEIAAFAFCLFTNWVFKRTWKYNIAFSVILVTIIYCIFSLGLKIEFTI
jgi:hypothetical protein